MGINVNLDKVCTFACPYCQVDRREPQTSQAPPVNELLAELDRFLGSYAQTGDYQGHQLKDISIAGDGEPTTYKELPQLLEGLISRQQDSQTPFKLVLFTNGTHLNRTDLADLWARFFEVQGEVWFKLDFWDQVSFERANGSQRNHQAVLDNLLQFSKAYPVTLQCCFFHNKTQPIDTGFAALWSAQLTRLMDQGLQVQLIQVYTIARTPADQNLVAYDQQAMDKIGDQIRQATGQTVEIYYSH